LETDIEKAREEGNWKKVIELATQLKDKGERGAHFFPVCGSLGDSGSTLDPDFIGSVDPGRGKEKRPQQRNLRFEKLPVDVHSGWLEVLH
jgi:hypothetical protein